MLLQIALWNQTSSEIQATLCDPAKLQDALTLPEFANMSYADISAILCDPNVTATVDALKNALNMDIINMLVSINLSYLNCWYLLN